MKIESLLTSLGLYGRIDWFILRDEINRMEVEGVGSTEVSSLQSLVEKKEDISKGGDEPKLKDGLGLLED